MESSGPSLHLAVQKDFFCNQYFLYLYLTLDMLTRETLGRGNNSELGVWRLGFQLCLYDRWSCGLGQISCPII